LLLKDTAALTVDPASTHPCCNPCWHLYICQSSIYDIWSIHPTIYLSIHPPIHPSRKKEWERV